MDPHRGRACSPDNDMGKGVGASAPLLLPSMRLPHKNIVKGGDGFALV